LGSALGGVTVSLGFGLLGVLGLEVGGLLGGIVRCFGRVVSDGETIGWDWWWQ
jgi:hypothetical protein